MAPRHRPQFVPSHASVHRKQHDWRQVITISVCQDVGGTRLLAAARASGCLTPGPQSCDESGFLRPATDIE
jgi:hypothetical protein